MAKKITVSAKDHLPADGGLMMQISVKDIQREIKKRGGKESSLVVIEEKSSNTDPKTT